MKYPSDEDVISWLAVFLGIVTCIWAATAMYVIGR